MDVRHLAIPEFGVQRRAVRFGHQVPDDRVGKPGAVFDADELDGRRLADARGNALAPGPVGLLIQAQSGPRIEGSARGLVADTHGFTGALEFG